MASANTVTVLVKTLSGDLLSLEVSPSVGLKGVADALTRFDSERFPPLQTKVFFHHPEKAQICGSVVENGDELSAFVDPSLVHPVVIHGGNRSIPTEGYCMSITTYHVGFRSRELDEELFTHHYYDACDIYHNNKLNLFALKSTFQDPTPSEKLQFEKEGFYFPSLATDQTKWYPSVIECIQSIPNACFPQNDETCSSIQTDIFELIQKNLLQERMIEECY
jgi:hypothetical protein